MDTKALVTQIVSQLEPYIVSAIVAALGALGTAVYNAVKGAANHNKVLAAIASASVAPVAPAAPALTPATTIGSVLSGQTILTHTDGSQSVITISPTPPSGAATIEVPANKVS
jgi:hypothetical protein